jgi:acetyl-CoA carboxylase alpha subunit
MAERQTPEAAWETVQLARHQDRPQTLDYIALTLPDFLPLSGDRLHGDDKAIVGGMATLGKYRIMLIGHQKGHTLKERQEHSFGMTRPEGYRKAMRLARLAEKFGLPVVSRRVSRQGRRRGRTGRGHRAQHRDLRHPHDPHGDGGPRRGWLGRRAGTRTGRQSADA